MEKITKKYTNGEITVIWQPHLCVHATTCFTELPKVFIPYERPWIKMDGATTEEIIDTVGRCPTDALTYFWNKKQSQNTENEDAKKTEISIIKNGPFVVKGSFRITDIDGNEIVCQKSAALCRCGRTKNRPFCDGTHTDWKFKLDDESSEGTSK